MNKMAFDVTPDERVFDTGGRITLADVLAECEEEMTGNALRDTRSAFRFLERKCGIELGGTLARPQEVRGILAGLSPVLFSISGTHLANVQSRVRTAVARFGMRRTWITREIPLDANWAALMGRIPDREHRWALSRLACYCTVKGIAPAEVTPETLRGLLAALEAEALSKDPRNLLKHTVAVWNMGLRRVPDWPGSPLSSPFKKEPFMLPLEAFPVAFGQAVAAFEARMSRPDPLDPAAPVRASRPDTLESYRNTFRRAASALVRGGHIEFDAVTGFEVFFAPENFKEALRPFLPKSEDQDTGYVHKMAIQLITVARQHVGQDDARIRTLEQIARPLKPKTGGMGKRNRKRLEQFDNEDVVQRLLRFPEEERAPGAETAQSRAPRQASRTCAGDRDPRLAGPALKNLRQLRLDRNLRRAGTRVFLRLSETETKTHAELELELTPETIAMLDELVAEARPLLPGAEGPFLFPGETGGARSYSAMRDAVSKPLLRHARITLSPHLYRHIIAKIVVERFPEHLHDVSRMLGHKSVNTTYAAYLGTEGPVASRRITALLRRAVRTGNGGQE